MNLTWIISHAQQKGWFSICSNNKSVFAVLFELLLTYFVLWLLYKILIICVTNPLDLPSLVIITFAWYNFSRSTLTSIANWPAIVSRNVSRGSFESLLQSWFSQSLHYIKQNKHNNINTITINENAKQTIAQSIWTKKYQVLDELRKIYQLN